MLRPILLFMSLMGLTSAGFSQSGEATSAPPAVASASKGKTAFVRKTPQKKSEPSALDCASTWLRSGGAEALKRFKASQAEALVRTAPKQFAGAKAMVTDLATKIQKGLGTSLTQKKNLLIQLWKLRGSLDVMALLDPHTLETLTGIDAKTLAGLQKTAATLAKSFASLTRAGTKG